MAKKRVELPPYGDDEPLSDHVRLCMRVQELESQVAKLTRPPKMGPTPRAGETGQAVAFKATSQERAAWRAAADQDGLTLSAWIRAACDTRLVASKMTIKAPMFARRRRGDA